MKTPSSIVIVNEKRWEGGVDFGKTNRFMSPGCRVDSKLGNHDFCSGNTGLCDPEVNF